MKWKESFEEKGLPLYLFHEIMNLIGYSSLPLCMLEEEDRRSSGYGGSVIFCGGKWREAALRTPMKRLAATTEQTEAAIARTKQVGFEGERIGGMRPILYWFFFLMNSVSSSLSSASSGLYDDVVFLVRINLCIFIFSFCIEHKLMMCVCVVHV